MWRARATNGRGWGLIPACLLGLLSGTVAVAMQDWRAEVRERWTRGKWWMLGGLAVAVALVVGGVIAGDSQDDTPSRTAEPASERPAASESGSSAAQIAQEVAREVCSTAGQAQMAREFRVPNDLTAVVEAYGEGSTEPARAASERGCLEGLTE